MAVWLVPVPSILTAILCVFGKTPKFIRRWSVAGSSATLLLCGWMSLNLAANGFAAAKSSGLLWDALSAYLAMIISVLALIASFSSGDFMEHETALEKAGIKSWRTYYGLFHIFVATMLLVSISDNLGLVWIMIETTTLSSAFLVGFHRHRHSIEAAWKYVVLCSIGIAFALFGTILLYYASVQGGHSHALNWTSFVQIAPGLDPQLVKLAFLFIALGYGTKAGLAPMHTWLPDAHSQAPSPISALLSGALLSAAFCALARFYAITVRCVGPQYPGTILIFFGLVSLAVAMPFILVARDYKRMLAYSSVEHMGFLSFGLGIGTPVAIYGMSLHVLFHALGKGLAFLSAGRILKVYGTRKINKVAGVLSVTPETGIPFLAAALALAGLPPFGIFTSEFIVLSSGFSSGRGWSSLFVLALLAIIFSGFLYHLIQMSFGVKQHGSHESAAPERNRLWIVSASMILLAMVVLGFWIPGPLDRWVTEIVRIVQGDFHAGL